MTTAIWKGAFFLFLTAAAQAQEVYKGSCPDEDNPNIIGAVQSCTLYAGQSDRHLINYHWTEPRGLRVVGPTNITACDSNSTSAQLANCTTLATNATDTTNTTNTTNTTVPWYLRTDDTESPPPPYPPPDDGLVVSGLSGDAARILEQNYVVQRPESEEDNGPKMDRAQYELYKSIDEFTPRFQTHAVVVLLSCDWHSEAEEWEQLGGEACPHLHLRDEDGLELEIFEGYFDGVNRGRHQEWAWLSPCASFYSMWEAEVAYALPRRLDDRWRNQTFEAKGTGAKHANYTVEVREVDVRMNLDETKRIPLGMKRQIVEPVLNASDPRRAVQTQRRPLAMSFFTDVDVPAGKSVYMRAILSAGSALQCDHTRRGLYRGRCRQLAGVVASPTCFNPTGFYPYSSWVEGTAVSTGTAPYGSKYMYAHIIYDDMAEGIVDAELAQASVLFEMQGVRARKGSIIYIILFLILVCIIGLLLFIGWYMRHMKKRLRSAASDQTEWGRFDDAALAQQQQQAHLPANQDMFGAARPTGAPLAAKVAQPDIIRSDPFDGSGGMKPKGSLDVEAAAPGSAASLRPMGKSNIIANSQTNFNQGSRGLSVLGGAGAPRGGALPPLKPGGGLPPLKTPSAPGHPPLSGDDLSPLSNSKHRMHSVREDLEKMRGVCVADHVKVFDKVLSWRSAWEAALLAGSISEDDPASPDRGNSPDQSLQKWQDKLGRIMKTMGVDNDQVNLVLYEVDRWRRQTEKGKRSTAGFGFDPKAEAEPAGMSLRQKFNSE